MARTEKFSDEFLIGMCEDRYEKKGLVNITELAGAIEMSRVHLSNRISKMVKMGKISEERYRLWTGPASRGQASRHADMPKNKKMNITFTPENYKYLKSRDVAASEYVNSLVNLDRQKRR